MVMELMGKLAWLVLSTYAAAVQSIGFEAGRNGVVDIHTLMAGMQVLQTVSVAQIAHFLDIPAGSPTLSQITASWETESALRQALETTCRIRDRVESLADLQQKLPDDIEVNVMLQVLKHTLEDSCHWVADLAGRGRSVCSEDTINNICIRWEALVVSEEAEHDLLVFMEEVRVTVNEWLSRSIKITSPQIFETIMNYF